MERKMEKWKREEEERGVCGCGKLKEIWFFSLLPSFCFFFFFGLYFFSFLCIFFCFFFLFSACVCVL